jgi:hypothetical protein
LSKHFLFLPCVERNRYHFETNRQLIVSFKQKILFFKQLQRYCYLQLTLRAISITGMLLVILAIPVIDHSFPASPDNAAILIFVLD